ncbi:MAG: type II toxin-antitoxin system VapB family antitoxin [Acidobacteria bacterium]|uniref:Type II toxin-antitoxin system VapB family antitoxin n=1 Tax=Candidatus Polarisedimenticola svalbardensis TaxID=2886004 RepID=A0A8J7C258_9BACT|nr:type II toxin-antitoxin system VapB family antitoxin [Candidatus Polarisedimenticola svalbardensis]
MPTNLALDDDLVSEAKKLGNHRSKKDAVNQALLEYVSRRKRRKMLDLFEKVDWDERYDYKEDRKRRG